jgi:hypothetical protein
MTEKRKDQLESELSTNFADNNTGAITPQIYRDYMTNVMDSYDIWSAADTTYYVRATGDDANDGLSAGNALATIQEAVNRLPRVVRHALTIDIGEGDFDGAAFEGFRVTASSTAEGRLRVLGALGAPTGVGTPLTGTADSGSTTTLGLSTAAWTVNALKGMLVLSNSEYRTIASNTADTITFQGEFSATTDAKAFSIVESKTNIDTIETFASSACIYVAGCSTNWRKNMVFENLKLSPPASGFAGFMAFETEGLQLKTCQVVGTSGHSNGVLIQSVTGEFSIEDVSVTGPFSAAAFNLVWNSGTCRLLRGGADTITSSGKGASLQYSTGAIEAIDFTANACSSVGVQIQGCTRAAIDRMVSSNNSSCGIKAENCWVIVADGSKLTGAANATFGVRALPRTHFEFSASSGVPTITGATADATNNEGASTLSWSSNFGTDGSIAPNSDTHTSIYRND